MNLWIRFETMFSRVFTFKPENRSFLARNELVASVFV